MNDIQSQTEGLKSLKEYLEANKNVIENDMNEADTRFHIIDQVLFSLGWHNSDFKLEKHENGDYTDYELGNPRKLIIEAKRTNVNFDLPPNPRKKNTFPINDILSNSYSCKEAFEQAQRYCAARGVRYAVITNGHQYISFLATRDDGISPANGKCLIFSSLKEIIEKFPLLWSNLSADAVMEHRLAKTLSANSQVLPKKISCSLSLYPHYKTPSDLHSSLKSLSELLIQDIFESERQEKDFIDYCYCESGAIAKDSLLSKNILNARYSSLFNNNESKLPIADVRVKKGESFDKEVITDAMSKRPIVLLGDVGVGKTSFIKNLQHNSAFEEFKNAIFIKIDLGSSATLTDDIKNYVLTKIKDTLFENYELNIEAKDFISGVYSRDIQLFSQTIYGSLKEADPVQYEREKINMLIGKMRDKAEHLKKSINYASNTLKKQIIIIIDNADQRDFDTQQEAFLIAQELAKNWKAIVFISVRPKTFFYSQRNGALSAYANKIFTIKPPRIDLVIRKRLLYAIEIAKGELSTEDLNKVLIRSENLVTFLSSLVYSLDENDELTEFISNITGGNVRQAIDIVKGFIGSPNVDVERIISETEKSGDYYIQLHEFSKSVLLGELSHFYDERSIAMNLFDVSYPDPKEHFLKSLIISFLNHDSPSVDKDGFVEGLNIYSEMQGLGYNLSQIDNAITSLVNKKLIESNKRFTFGEDDLSILDKEAIIFRATSTGIYHVKKWAPTFVYMDTICYDTPIFSDEVYKKLIEKIDSNMIIDRNIRTKLFKEYLITTWRECGKSTEYYDFEEGMLHGSDTFRFVEKACQAIEKDQIQASH
ncbi:P-loop NTPase fold protein [Brenneria populi]|uniref:P-loop NTPase fold protein n=1 Tax=Brenneria populi TaxID=1505588 RepID=A0ABU6JWY0_9GAMM|nr:P-loop NTPase fold protein [Brenneria populi Li et al. 2015]